jgi:hypothetical protein
MSQSSPTLDADLPASVPVRLVGGSDYNPCHEEWREEYKALFSASRARRAVPFAPNIPCECCGWDEEYRGSTSYFSQVKLMYAVHNRALWQLGSDYILKVDHNAHFNPGGANEVQTYRLLREKTTIPVCGEGFHWQQGNSRHQILPRLPGKSFHTVPVTPEESTAIWHEVGRHLQQVRQLECDEMVTAQGTPAGGGYDLGIAGGLLPPSREAFLEYLATHRKPNPRYSEWELEQFRNRCPSFKPYVFTHGDLDMSNILVDENKNLVAIIDWEHSGYKPVWWERYKLRMAGGGRILKEYVGHHSEAMKWLAEFEDHYPWSDM